MIDFSPEGERKHIEKTLKGAQELIRETVLGAQTNDVEKAKELVVDKLMELGTAMGMLAAAYYPDESPEEFSTHMAMFIAHCIENTREALKNAEAAENRDGDGSAWE